VNFSAIHTTSMAFTQALFSLAARPQYIQPIREEVERVIAEDGWSKLAMTKMRKLDSFLKENFRFDSISELSITRKAVVDYTLSDGTFLPKGTFVSAAVGCMHNDDDFFDKANEFDGFRFSSTRDEDGESTKHQMVSVSSEYLAFGYGKHACPGRFFAANEIKAMTAHVLLTYDIKLDPADASPKYIPFGALRIPNPKSKVMFRKRQV